MVFMLKEKYAWLLQQEISHVYLFICLRQWASNIARDEHCIIRNWLYFKRWTDTSNCFRLLISDPDETFRLFAKYLKSMLSKHYKDELKLQTGIPPTSLHALSVYLLVVSHKYLYTKVVTLVTWNYQCRS